MLFDTSETSGSGGLLETSRVAAPSSGVRFAASQTQLSRYTSATISTGRYLHARNIYACLVHEASDCVADLVHNLQKNDPQSGIILYNGGRDSSLLSSVMNLQSDLMRVHPQPTPLRWGRLHKFALDTMEYALRNFQFDFITVVDSDQLSVRPGYSQFIGDYFKHHPDVGMLGTTAVVESRDTTAGPAKAAFREKELWLPYLRRFAGGESKFPHWTFWPGTIFSAAAARELASLFSNDLALQGVLSRSRIWATEEVILPTLVALLGFKIAVSPCGSDFVKYKVRFDEDQIKTALEREDVFWIHPVRRQLRDQLRSLIRKHCGYLSAVPEDARDSELKPVASERPIRKAAPRVRSVHNPIVRYVRNIEGWLLDDEAELLIRTTTWALRKRPGSHLSGAIVEVGSYCGKATIAMALTAKRLKATVELHSVDSHDGWQGARDTGLVKYEPSLGKFRRNIRIAGVQSIVHEYVCESSGLRWNKPIRLLLIDGLHDFESVSSDYRSFAAFIEDGGYIAFHDYADYFPNVVRFVDSLLNDGCHHEVDRAQSLIVLQRRKPS